MFFMIASETVRRAELHVLGAGLVADADVAWREIEGITGLEDLFMIGKAIGEPTLGHVAPVRALASIIRQPLEHGGLIDVFARGQEVHRAVAKLLAPLDYRALVATLGRTVLRSLRHQ